jgi:hypothetical protein
MEARTTANSAGEFSDFRNAKTNALCRQSNLAVVDMLQCQLSIAALKRAIEMSFGAYWKGSTLLHRKTWLNHDGFFFWLGRRNRWVACLLSLLYSAKSALFRVHCPSHVQRYRKEFERTNWNRISYDDDVLHLDTIDQSTKSDVWTDRRSLTSEPTRRKSDRGANNEHPEGHLEGAVNRLTL